MFRFRSFIVPQYRYHIQRRYIGNFRDSGYNVQHIEYLSVDDICKAILRDRDSKFSNKFIENVIQTDRHELIKYMLRYNYNVIEKLKSSITEENSIKIKGYLDSRQKVDINNIKINTPFINRTNKV